MGQPVDRSICSWFWAQADPSSGHPQLPSVMASPTYYVLHIVREGITFLACSKTEMPPLLGIEFLCRVADVLSEYFGGLTEDLIKDNFVIVYELLDEMMDNGYPLTTEVNVLKDMIAPPNIVSRMLSVVTGGSSNMNTTLPIATASNWPWRGTDLKYSNNEVYFDLVEEMDVIVNRDGFLMKYEVYGEIHVIARLSGVPELTVNFANASILSDVRFHPCVQFRPWETHQVLTFVPPDGEFKLMRYRVKNLKNTPVYVKPQFTSSGGLCRVNILVGVRNDPGKQIDFTTLEFPLPAPVTSWDLTPNYGSVSNSPGSKTLTWTIGKIPKDKSPCLSGTLHLEKGVEQLQEFPTLLVGFKIMGVAMSGLRIDKTDVQNVAYNAYKGFRAVSRAASYEVRT
ncbi:hypothetical protein GOP47_0023620 [Adiantum capillus-veneris]|uniref:MHD domain-containing protein n=1 Tax=Adiantum capillus-veneris TaxID=13818 RepID=A0A9D4U4B1_ADICA|nr:hypothetical protein GOP47_0023620 [Adiantum capillus-veneris]